MNAMLVLTGIDEAELVLAGIRLETADSKALTDRLLRIQEEFEGIRAYLAEEIRWQAQQVIREEGVTDAQGGLAEQGTLPGVIK